jgi:hypothetical protein
MNWRRILAAERNVTIIGSISLASSGCYTFLITGLCRLIFDMDEYSALLWIGIPFFIILLILHIRWLPKHLRKAGFIE